MLLMSEEMGPVNCLLTFRRWILMHGSNRWGSVSIVAWGNVLLLLQHQVLQTSLYSCGRQKSPAARYILKGNDAGGGDSKDTVQFSGPSRRPCIYNRHLQTMSLTSIYVYFVACSRYSDWLRAGRSGHLSSRPGRVKIFLFSTSSRPSLLYNGYRRLFVLL
jgi:hypothetical protein